MESQTALGANIVRKPISESLTIEQVRGILDLLRQNEFAGPFNEPVDVKGLGLTDYYEIVTTPMDLGTVRNKIETKQYTTAEQVINDIQLVWKNAMKYNRKGSPIYNCAFTLNNEFENMLQLAKKDLLYPKQEQYCSICKLGGILFKCNGPCRRSFHLHCVGLNQPPNANQKWACNDCILQFKQQQQRQQQLQLQQQLQQQQQGTTTLNNSNNNMNNNAANTVITNRVIPANAMSNNTVPTSGISYNGPLNIINTNNTNNNPRTIPIVNSPMVLTNNNNINNNTNGMRIGMNNTNTNVGNVGISNPLGMSPNRFANVIQSPMTSNGIQAPMTNINTMLNRTTIPSNNTMNNNNNGITVIGGLPQNTISPRQLNPNITLTNNTSQLISSNTGNLNSPLVVTTVSNEAYMKSQMVDIMDEMEALVDTQGRQISGLFLELPNKELYPDYYQLILCPISMAEIRSKIPVYKTIEEYKQDFLLMFKNAQTYNIPKSQVYKDSQKLEKFFIKEIGKRFPVYATPTTTPGRRGRKPNKIIDYSLDFEDDEDEEQISIDDEPTGTPNKGMTTPIKIATNTNNNNNSVYYDDGSDDDETVSSERKKQPVKSEIPLDLSPPKSIEKILGDRVKEGSDPTAPEYEYFVKWKNRSYLHVSWVGEPVIAVTTAGRTRIKRYWLKKQESEQQSIFKEYNEDMEGNAYFTTDLCEVERIIAMKEIEINGVKQTYYLVKWKTLNYTESSWEKPEDIKDDQKISEFKKFNTKPFLPAFSPTAQQVRAAKRWIKMETSPPFKAGHQLRPYQLEGLNWLVFCWYESRGSILADEMGLGKTIQAISFLHYLHVRENIHGPFLIIAPLSTIGHWQREIEEWTDLNVILYQGNKGNRELIRNYDFYYTNNQGTPINKQELKFNVLLTTFEMLLGDDWGELQQIRWRALVTDEAQRLKNQASKLLLRMKQFKSEHRILLTGTPIQNNTQELWSLLNFIEPVKFVSLDSFSKEFGVLKDADQVSKLHAVLRPHLLRRMKEDVEKSIPPKEETLVEVELTSIQKQYYRAILEKNRDFLNKGCTAKNVPNLINIVMQLRKVCNHPYLVKGVEEKESFQRSKEEYYQYLVNSSGKLILLDKLLPKLKEGGHKVLIFSQMIKVLDLLESYLRFRGYQFERLDGGVRGNERQASIDRFCKPGSDRFVFLLCTRAGGVGINLTSADTVIIYDSDWNPQNDIQAQARCHRIGQTQEVKVYRLITGKTYERHMFERSSKKLGLDQAVLHDMGAPALLGNSSGQQSKSLLDKKEIDTLLKYGAYELFKEDDKEQEKRFKEEDIDQILNRSSKVVWKEAVENGENGAAQPSSFSMASFASAQSDSVDIDDPNFWDLILPEAKTAANLIKKLDRGELETKQDRSLFMRDLRDLVDDVLMGFKDGKMEEVARGRQALMQLFERIRFDMGDFTEEQQARILQWTEEITRPSRRERKGTSRFGNDDLYLDDKFSTPNKKDNKFKLKKIKRTSMWKQWTDKERRHFHSAFMLFGLDRWEEIRNNSQLYSATDEDCKEYSEELIKQCIVHADQNDRQIYIEYLTSILSPNETLQIELRVDSDFTKLIKRKVKGWSHNVQLLQKYRQIFSEINDVQTIKDVLEIPWSGRKLTKWWNLEQDRSLILGIFKHGIDNYINTLSDPLLSIHQFIKEVTINADFYNFVDNSDVPSNNGEYPFYTDDSVSNNTTTTTINNNNNAPQNTTNEEKTVQKEENKENNDDQKELIETEIDSQEITKTTIKEETTPIENLSSTTSSAVSKDIKSEIQNNIENTSNENSNNSNNDNKEKKIEKIQCPTESTLEAHLQYLLDILINNYNNNTKLRQRIQRAVEKQNMKKRIQEDRESQWTKREQNDFRLALISYGQGNWERISTSAKLAKSYNQMQYYYEHLLSECKKIVTEGDKKKTRGGSKQEGKSGSKGDWEDELEDSDDDDDSEPAEKKRKVDKSNKNKKNKHNVVNENNEPKGMVSYSMAKRIIQRVQLFDEIKRASQHSQLKDKLANAHELKQGPINWWISPLHDEYLLQSILKYGIGTDDWNELLENKQCTFYIDEDGQFDYKKHKETFLKEYTKDKLELIRRLEYLCVVVLDNDYSRSRREKRKQFEGRPSVVTRDISRDEEGRPIVPFNAKGATIISLGSIVWDKTAFHSKNYIWPVGFKSSRKLPSIGNSKEYVTYTSEILDGGNGPLFKVTPSNNPKLVQTHSTSSGVWCEMLKLIKRKAQVSVSGPEMFGFSDPLVKMLIQELPDARKCTHYQWVDFDNPHEKLTDESSTNITTRDNSNNNNNNKEDKEDDISPVSNAHTTPNRNSTMKTSLSDEEEDKTMELEDTTDADFTTHTPKRGHSSISTSKTKKKVTKRSKTNNNNSPGPRLISSTMHSNKPVTPTFVKTQNVAGYAAQPIISSTIQTTPIMMADDEDSDDDDDDKYYNDKLSSDD